MRSRTFFSVFFFLTCFLVLPLAAHAAIPFFGPIIPDAQNVCPGSWGMLLIVVNNIISFLITLAIVFVAPVTIAYAGFLYVWNPMDPGGIAKARSILTNTVVGIVVALAAWMIVDAVMVVLYNGSFGTWASIIKGDANDLCLTQKGALPTDTLTQTQQTGVTVVTPATNCANSYQTILPGISISSSGNCCDKTKPSCTSLDGMLPTTIAQIKNVKDKCGAITVTGGTEVGHSGEGNVGSHSGGSKVDISQNIISCITRASGSVIVSSPSFGSSQVKDRCGNLYTWEGNHTDISVVSACSL